MEQPSQAVVLAIAHAVSDASDLLGHEVPSFDGSGRDARRVEAEDFLLPARDGGGEAGELGNVRFGDIGVEADQPPVSSLQCQREVALPKSSLPKTAAPTSPVGSPSVSAHKSLSRWWSLNRSQPRVISRRVR